MKQQQFRGTGVALVTPFKDGEIDFSSLNRIIEHTINGGVDYLVSLGTTGEAVTLSAAECRKVFDFTIKSQCRARSSSRWYCLVAMTQQLWLKKSKNLISQVLMAFCPAARLTTNPLRKASFSII